MGHPDGFATLARGFGQPIITLVAINLQHAVKTAQDGFGILACATWSVHAGRDLSAPWPVIAGQCPQISGFGCSTPRIQHRGGGFIQKQFSRPRQMIASRSNYGSQVERGIADPIGQSGPVQIRQAYWRRTVTMTRNCAGMMSSRSLRSSPILCIRPQPHGQIKLSGSMTSSIRGNVAGKLPMVRLGAGLVVPSPALAARFSFSASTSASAIDRSSNASCRSSSDSFSDRFLCPSAVHKSYFMKDHFSGGRPRSIQFKLVGRHQPDQPEQGAARH